VPAVGVDGHDWLLAIGWAICVSLAFVGIVLRTTLFVHAHHVESDPTLSDDVRYEATLRRKTSLRRVYLKLFMFIICILELSVVWDRWPFLIYDARDGLACVVMFLFLLWMLTWRET